MRKMLLPRTVEADGTTNGWIFVEVPDGTTAEEAIKMLAKASQRNG